MFHAQQLADKYVAIWNESDAERRRQQTAAFWVPEGQHYVDVRKALGYAELDHRIAGSHNKNVRNGGYRFRATRDARTLHDIAVFRWEILPAAEERAAARGFEVFRVDAEARNLVDYQFIV